MSKSQSKAQPAQASRPHQAAAAVAGPKGKLGVLIALLSRPEGARIEELTAATGWQPHSVRGAIAGAIKKKLGRQVVAEKTEQGRVYRIESEASA